MRLTRITFMDKTVIRSGVWFCCADGAVDRGSSAFSVYDTFCGGGKIIGYGQIEKRYFVH